MIILQKFLNVFVSWSLLSSPASFVKPVPQCSLWGKVADFNYQCSHLTLKPHVSIPALQEFTVCLHLKFEVLMEKDVQAISPWTAFMYHHPDGQNVELGLGGERGRLVVWLFGTKWTTPRINLGMSQWYSLCLTWSHTKDRLALYINGNLVGMMPDHTVNSSEFFSSSYRKLAPNGTLTLGVAHLGSNIQTFPLTGVFGKLSLFRLWGRERNKQEVTSLYCTEGDLVNWEMDNWDTKMCTLLPDSSLQCEWSFYEVRLKFDIICYDGNNTEPYTAREIAHHWIREVLPASMYLNRVSVFEVTRSSSEDSLVKTSHVDRLVRWTSPNINGLDVATVQNEIYMDLKVPYHHPNRLLQLFVYEESIHTTPIESFSTATTSPPEVVTKPSPVTTTTSTTSTTTTTTTTTSPSTFSPTTTLKATTTSASTSTSTGAVTVTTTTSTTTTTSPTNISELYFEVKVNVSIRGVCDPEQILSTWLNSSLPDDMMRVLDLQLLTKATRYHPHPQSNQTDGVFVHRVSRESCIFQVQVMMSLSDTQEMEEQLRHLLLMPYYNGSITIATEDIQISRILIIKCNAESHQTRKGLFEWPATSGGKNATWLCPKNPRRYATRHCKLCLSTHWMAPDLEACPLVVETIPDLDHVEVTADNALDVVEMIEGLLSNQSTLNYHELVTVLNKLEDIVDLSVVTPNLGQALINIISDILESDSNLLPFTNTILNITEAVGDRMVGYEGSYTLVASAVAISVVDVVPGQFSSLTFGVSSDRAGTKPEIFINRYPFNSTVAFISLPSALQHSFPQNSLNQSPPRVQFQFYGIPMLFKNSQKGQTLNTFVVSASVTNASSPIKDLDEDVKVTLHHLIPNTLYKDVQCVYWNFNKNNGDGGWDDYGCRKYNSSSDYTTCLCDHLTHFGVLLDVSRTQVDPANEQTLTIITYVGCGVSSLFLGITVLTYTVFEKLRRDYPSQILINLSLALLGLNLVFLVNSWLSSWGLYALCVAAASTLHYFLLASFTWMGLEAVNMYFALVKVFNVYVPSYILKFCALGWGLPLMICILVLIVDRDAYGSHLYTDGQPNFESLDNSNNFCWLQDNVTFYVSVVAYAVLVFLFNIGVFVVVLIQIRHMRVNSPAGTRSGLMHDLKGVASLTLLLGLTWTVGFFTFGPARVVLLYLFSGLNSLQGLLIFLFHCLMKENVRKQWRIHLCFGRFRLEEYSEWSNSASAGVVAKPRLNPLRASVPSVHSVKSSSTESTSASSDSSQRDSSCKRPNLGLFVNSLALPRAQRSPSGTRAVPSQRGMNQASGRRNHLLDQQEQR
ncbi:adhesion G-protein coupled receptor G4 isoform X2 [Seriola aureovittata]|uniref:adhesion G-protein coupled receptor G4 isoform X2 n=1 Tax=Seriola aureovittata TaxID=2871759 RepID=UPI0024BE9684|nr:adhesion G-protein coupled receptor G4 isoform X2 [Seriola aureovittata]